MSTMYRAAAPLLLALLAAPALTQTPPAKPADDKAAAQAQGAEEQITALMRGWIEPKLRRLRTARIGLDGTPEPVHPDQELD